MGRKGACTARRTRAGERLMIRFQTPRPSLESFPPPCYHQGEASHESEARPCTKAPYSPSPYPLGKHS